MSTKSVRLLSLTIRFLGILSLLSLLTANMPSDAQSSRHEESITLLFPNDTTNIRDEFTIRLDNATEGIDLSTLNFRWNDGSTDQRFNLGDQTQIRTTVQNSRSGQCIQLYASSLPNTAVPLCNNVISQPITPAEVFWGSQTIAFDVYQGDALLTTCATAGTTTCSFDWQTSGATGSSNGETEPTNTPDPSPTATDTVAPVVPTATETPASNKNNDDDDGESAAITVAKYGLIGVVAAAIIGAIATVVAAYINRDKQSGSNAKPPSSKPKSSRAKRK